MPEQAIDLVKRVSPMDADGMNLSRPANQVLWTLLENVVIHNGRIETRPGLVPLGPRVQDVSSILSGIPTIIAQAQRYTDEDTSIGISETLFPSSTPAAGTWGKTGAATLHEAVDDDPPDSGTTSIDSSTDGDAFTMVFGPATDAFEAVDGVVVNVRARAKLPNEIVTLTISDVNGTYGVFRITSADFDSDATTQPGWQDYFLSISRKSNGDAFRKADLSAYIFTLGLGEAGQPSAIDILVPQSYVVNEFSEAVLSNWMTQSEVPLAFFDISNDTFTNAFTLGDKMSVTFDGLAATWGAVALIQLQAKCAKRTIAASPKIRFFHTGTDSVDRYMGEAVYVHRPSKNTLLPLDGGDVMEHVIGANIVTSGEVAINPETSNAWTPAEINAGLVFGIELVELSDPGQSLEVSSFEAIAEGSTTTSGVEIDAINVTAFGRDLDGADPSESMARILGTHSGFQRLNEQNNKEDGFEDVSGSISGPTASPLSWDWTEFFNKLYVTNAADKIYRYPDASEEFDQLSTDMLVHTLWTFGNRLMGGDVIDAGTRHPKRVAWTALAADDTWSGDAAAGDLDLTHGGQGRLVKGLPLSSHVAALYLDLGIYNLNWTGDDSAPFLPRMVDNDTGIVAPNTCKAVIDQGGSSTHIFLGRGPNGVDVYSYDGSQAVPIGGEIRDDLVKRSNASTLRHAFAALEPRKNLYLLFIPEGDQLFPEQCWVYDIDTGHWTRWTFSIEITCAGMWKLVDTSDATTPGKTVLIQDGETELLLGTSMGTVYRFDPDRFTDVITPGGDDDDFTREFFETTTTSDTGYYDDETPINVDIRTGDVEFSDDASTRQTGLKRFFLTHVDQGPVDIVLDESVDGGTSFINTVAVTLDGLDTGKIKNVDIPIPIPTSSRRHMIRIRTASTSQRQKFEMVDFTAYYQDYGEVP